MLNFVPSQKHSLIHYMLKKHCENEQIINGENLNDYLNLDTNEINLILPIHDASGDIIPNFFNFIIDNNLYIQDEIEIEYTLSLLSNSINPDNIWVDYISHFLIDKRIESNKLKICHNLYDACKNASLNKKDGLLCHKDFIEQLDLPIQKIYSTQKVKLAIISSQKPKNIKNESHLILNYEQQRNLNLTHILHPFYNQNIELQNIYHRPHKSQIYLKLNNHFTQNKVRKAIYHFEKELQQGTIKILGHNTI